MPGVNDLLLDEAIRHHIALMQYERGVVRRMMGILNHADDVMFAELQAELGKLSPSTFTMTRLQSMLGSTRALSAMALSAIDEELTRELREFTDYEVAYRKALMDTILEPVRVSVASVNAEEVFVAAMESPFQGVLLRGALSDLGAHRAKLVERTIAQGFVQSKTTDTIIRELRGTSAMGFQDGIMERPRRELAAITQTALAHMAGTVADRAAAANSDIVQSIRWSATLDNKTSEGCRVRDGKLYDPVTHEPQGHVMPWGGGPGRLHWNCRSAGVEVLKSFKQLGIDMPEITIGGTRASMDGQVPKDTTYFDWLRRQSAERQDQVLGPVRGKLMRQGGLKPEEMYADRGRYLTIAELRERDADAFRRAGL